MHNKVLSKVPDLINVGFKTLLSLLLLFTCNIYLDFPSFVFGFYALSTK